MQQSQHNKDNATIKARLKTLHKRSVKDHAIAEECREYVEDMDIGRWYVQSPGGGEYSAINAICLIRDGEQKAKGIRREVLLYITGSMLSDTSPKNKKKIHKAPDVENENVDFMRAVDHGYVVEHFILTGEVIDTPPRTPRRMAYRIEANETAEEFRRDAARMLVRWALLIQSKKKKKAG